MPDPSIVRFRRILGGAAAYLEVRRQEVNDLNVFPVADGDTGDNMAMTLRAVVAELDRLVEEDVEDIGRTQLVRGLARAALMGARGNSGVILSQIVRGAADVLASRPGELIDPTLIAAAFATASDEAYASVREPVEGTMLTVFREVAHSVTRQLTSLEAASQRLDHDTVTPEVQDQVLAHVLEQAMRDGEAAVARTPEQLAVLREAGVVDAGGQGLVLILAGAVAALRGEPIEEVEVATHAPPRMTRPHHGDSRFRYCTNFIVTGEGLAGREFVPRLEEIGDSVLVVGDEATLKVHVHTDEPDAAVGLFESAGAVANLDVADMREQIAERRERIASGQSASQTGAVAVASGEGMHRLLADLGAHVVDGGETLNPSTYELLAGIHEVDAAEVLVLPSSANVIMAAERACELSQKPARVVPSTSQQASLLALIELEPGIGRRGERRARLAERPRGDEDRGRDARLRATMPRAASAAVTPSASRTVRSSRGAGPGRRSRRPSSNSPPTPRSSRSSRAAMPRSRSPRSTTTSPRGSRSSYTTAASPTGGGC